jgi:hypothetical protein
MVDIVVVRFLHSYGEPYPTEICAMLVGSTASLLLLRYLLFSPEKGV